MFDVGDFIKLKNNSTIKIIGDYAITCNTNLEIIKRKKTTDNKYIYYIKFFNKNKDKFTTYVETDISKYEINKNYNTSLVHSEKTKEEIKYEIKKNNFKRKVKGHWLHSRWK